MANWTPGSLIGDVLRTLDRHSPPRADGNAATA
jgi:hypothetical protein